MPGVQYKSEKYDAEILRLNPQVWGPHFWFFLHTVALTYPDMPTETYKKKYYDFFYMLPLFLPDPAIAKRWGEWTDQYPVQPYLGSRDSLIRWVNYMHNRANRELGKDTIPLEESLRRYFEQYYHHDVDNDNHGTAATAAQRRGKSQYRQHWFVGVSLFLLCAYLLYKA